MDDHQLPPENPITRIRWMMLARVSIVSFLLAIAIFSELKEMKLLPEKSLPFYYSIIVATYGLSFFYLLFLHAVKNIKINVYIQAACDVAMITYMVYVTGGTNSIYSVFYTLVIIYSVLFMGRKGGLIIASGCSIAYAVLLELEYYGIINPLHAVIGDYPSLPGYVVSRIFTHILSFYLIAFLASFVVEQERKARRLLAEKEDAFNQLDLLHRSIVESVSVGIVTVNLSGKIKSFNRAAQDITDYSFAEVEEMNMSELFPRSADMPAKQDSGPAHAASRLEIPFETKKGRKLILGCSLSSLKNSRDERIGDIMIIQDLTSIKQMEESYEKSRKMAFIGEMAALLAHEIRNPLASISGSIQVLKRDLRLPESDERLMGIIVRGKEQLENFMRDFLLLARPTLGAPEMVTTKELIEDVLDALHYIPDWHEGIEIRKTLEENAKVFANRTEIRQVIWNLLLNALQAMPGKGALDIETKTGTFNGFSDCLQISVTDTGCGIEEKYVGKIFEPFFTTKERGTGLGLAIVNRIVESNRGKIRVISEAGKGTTCVITLPLRGDESATSRYPSFRGTRGRGGILAGEGN
jgi:two-component system, NtrC family, sensor histidine kinase PilS